MHFVSRWLIPDADSSVFRPFVWEELICRSWCQSSNKNRRASPKFERLLAELGFELWIGDPVQIKAKRVKKQKYDREDARLLLRLMRENNFPQIWIPSPENRDLRQLLWHRHRLVQMRTRIMNQLHGVAPPPQSNWCLMEPSLFHGMEL